MDILYLLIPLSVVLALLIGAAFWLAVDAGQFEDLEGPGLAVVVDDDSPGTPCQKSGRLTCVKSQNTKSATLGPSFEVRKTTRRAP